jgi:hypothetical protein
MALTREAADACATAREAATELHRLVPTVHGATAVGVREPFAEYGWPPATYGSPAGAGRARRERLATVARATRSW